MTYPIFGIYFLNKKNLYIYFKWKVYLTTRDQEKFGSTVLPLNGKMQIFIFLNHGLHYASCVFEGERVYDGDIFKLEEHTERLFYSAKRMGIQVPYSQKEINDACRNIVNIQKVKNGYVRPLIWRGSEMMAISAQKNKIHVAIATWEWGSYFDPKLKLNGIKLNISSWRRPAPNTIPWDTKAAGLYMICTLSKHEAEAQGFTDSLMLITKEILLRQLEQMFFLKIKRITHSNT